MRQIDSLESLPNNIWTYDGVQTKDGIGFVRSPQMFILESGERVVPTNLCFVPNVESGSQKSYKKVYYQEMLDRKLMEDDGLGDSLVWDPISKVSYVALPIEAGNFITSAKHSLEKLLKDGSRISEQLSVLIHHFYNIDFGILGSRQLGIEKPTSDIDLFVYGGDNIKDVTTKLSEQALREQLGIELRGQENNIQNGTIYAQEYGVSLAQGLLMAQNKLRYYLLVGDKKIKLTINSCFGREEEAQTSLFLAPKIGEISIIGEVIEDKHASSYPREFIVHIGNGNTIAVATHKWSTKNNVAKGQLATIKGNIRVWKDREFISLDTKDQNIFPYII